MVLKFSIWLQVCYSKTKNNPHVAEECMQLHTQRWIWKVYQPIRPYLHRLTKSKSDWHVLQYSSTDKTKSQPDIWWLIALHECVLDKRKSLFEPTLKIFVKDASEHQIFFWLQPIQWHFWLHRRGSKRFMPFITIFSEEQFLSLVVTVGASCKIYPLQNDGAWQRSW